jgi:glycosidase
MNRAKNISNINPHFGTSDDLKALVQACHARDIWVMVDVVANHMGCSGCLQFDSLYPFNDASHYHSNCDIVDWNNQNQVLFMLVYFLLRFSALDSLLGKQHQRDFLVLSIGVLLR